MDTWGLGMLSGTQKARPGAHGCRREAAMNSDTGSEGVRFEQTLKKQDGLRLRFLNAP